MRTQRISLLAYPALLALFATTSCRNLIEPSVGEESLSVAQTKAIEGINASIHSLELATSKDAIESRRRIAELEKQGERRRNELVEAQKEIVRRGKQLTNLLTDVGKAASALGVPGAAPVTELIGEISSRMSANSEKATEAKAKAESATNTATIAAEAEAKASSRREIEALRPELEKLITAGSATIEKNKERVTEFVDNAKTELRDNKQLEAQFRRELTELAAQFGASKEEVQKLEGASVNQLLGLITGGGGLGIAALLALLRTMGKSRASGEVDKLRAQLEGMAANVPTPTSGRSAK